MVQFTTAQLREGDLFGVLQRRQAIESERDYTKQQARAMREYMQRQKEYEDAMAKQSAEQKAWEQQILKEARKAGERASEYYSDAEYREWQLAQSIVAFSSQPLADAKYAGVLKKVQQLLKAKAELEGSQAPTTTTPTVTKGKGTPVTQPGYEYGEILPSGEIVP